MSLRALFQRRHVSALALLAMIICAWTGKATAQEILPTLLFRPHCESPDQTLCPLFDIADPSTMITPQMKTGDTLDVDIILLNPTQEKIDKVRLWISYDTEIFEGSVITISPSLPTVVPGQADFSPLSGYAKIAANSALGSEPADAILPIARLTFIVKNATNGVASPLSFYDQRSGIEGHTFVTTTTAPTQNLLTTPLGALVVQLVATPAAAEQPPAITQDPYAATQEFVPGGSTVTTVPPAADSLTSSVSSAAASSAAESSLASTSSVSSVTSSAAAALPTPSETSGTFGLIQVQNVRVGTKDNLLYVTWDALSHPKLQGYNVYFGTLRGRYLNRRGVSVASRGAVIRDLPSGKTYFVAVRGVDDKNQETAFSTEVSVEIGNPSTSSSPITGSLDLVSEIAPSATAPENPVAQMHETIDNTVHAEVPGKSGAPSGIVLLLLASAAIGTLLACRRQAIAVHRLPV